MKFKPKEKAGGMVVELARDEEQLPAAQCGTRSVFKLRRILVPVDFSECSKKALQYAVAFAEQFNGTLILLHVIEPYVPVSQLVPIDYKEIEKEARKTANELMLELEKTIPQTIPKLTVIEGGNPNVKIVAAANDLEADLIIIATHGRTGLKHIFMGSVAETVVRHAQCPVVVVREQEHEFVEIESPRLLSSIAN